MRARTRTGTCVAVAFTAMALMTPPSDAVEVEWVRQHGTAAADEYLDVEVKGARIIAVGSTNGAFPGGTANQGMADAVVRIYRPDGSVLRTHQFGGTGNDIATSVAIGGDGAYYVAGHTSAGIPGAAPSFAGGIDGFLRRYDSDGTVDFTRHFGGSGTDSALSVAVAGELVYVGTARNNGGGFSNTVGGVRQYNDQGEFDWQEDLPGFGHNVSAVAADATGVYAVGPVLGALPGKVSSGNLDAFIRRYQADGDPDWTKQFGTAGVDQALGVAAGPDGAYVAGYTDDPLPGQTAKGGDDAFLRRYAPNGTKGWTRQLGTGANDRGLAVDVYGQGVLISGTTNGELPGQNAKGGLDHFVRRYQDDGAASWTKQFGSESSDFAGAGVAGSSNGVFTAGRSFGPMPGQTAKGLTDGYAARLVNQ